MQYNIGDKVKFLNDIGTGTITKIIDKKNVMVLNEYDFEVPVNINELILVEAAPSEKLYTQTLIEEKKELVKPEIKEEINPVFFEELGTELNLHLAFLKNTQEDKDEFLIHLINDSNYNIYFTFWIKTEKGWQLTSNNLLEANTKIQISNVSREFINKRPEILIQSIAFSKIISETKETISSNIKIDPVKFFKDNSFKNNDFFEKTALIIPVYSESKLLQAIEELKKADFQKIVQQKESTTKEKIIKPSKNGIEEIDLHLQEVIDDPTGLNKADMLEVQLNKFRQKLNNAIKNKQKKIVFIHGLGNGRLKSELRREIDSKYKNCKYQDASFQQYGFGATLVLIY
ncbi:MAG: DUF2027 domain-containing protein [Chlorobi bacterium]|nr:DUF2027 domain-containing protein [Chlorobiota bacterium]